MSQKKLTLVILLIVVVLSGFDRDVVMKSEQLFNGKNLSGWDTYIGSPYDTVQKKFTGERLGLNNDPMKVFSVDEMDGKPAIHISGERFGGISTKHSYHNYHLQLEFKWGERKWDPKKSAKRDSGLLYHAVGEHGADGGFWMRSQEFQIQEGDCGDYWGVAGGVADVPAHEQTPKHFVYSPGAPLLTFSEKSPQGRNCVKNPDGEKAYGQWNVVELYCFGDTSVHVVNGTVTMVLFNSRQTLTNGEEPLTSGKIQLQSEGAKLYYRNITLERITAIPGKYLR